MKLQLIQIPLGDVISHFLHFDESDGMVPGFPEGKLGGNCVTQFFPFYTQLRSETTDRSSSPLFLP